MTKEQAIEVLNTYYRGENNDDREFCDAIEMAIKVLEQPTCEDCVSRQAVLDMATTIQTDDFSGNEIIEVIDIDDVKTLPPVTPTHGTCKDCKHYYMDEDGHGYHCEKFDYTRFPVYADFYCKDFEKRGDENEAD
jgi:hypothetical protein